MPSPSSFQFIFLNYVVVPILWAAVIVFCLWCYKRSCLVSPSSQDIEQGNPTNILERDHQKGKEQSIGKVRWSSSFRQKGEIRNWSECVICLEEFEEGDDCSVLSECKHIYHKACIDKWVIQERHCPVCRSSASIQ
ncbi:hypothetical protein Patl1_30923 [Pistacia atlantica]|uniref:Uncharacterized protein n=1 Tax=Pistacia atlantica TaxID=434234 RepID=A0ACC1AF25_9ROSI|nr:hypothetical protein Patl1_30923 [Pistacia atlantica]